MSIPVEKLTEEMLALPAEARALLADRLVESLDPLADDDVRACWRRKQFAVVMRCGPARWRRFLEMLPPRR